MTSYTDTTQRSKWLLRLLKAFISKKNSARAISKFNGNGVRTYKRGTVNRGTVKRGQLIAGQLIARTHNRADT